MSGCRYPLGNLVTMPLGMWSVSEPEDWLRYYLQHEVCVRSFSIFKIRF
jgi:hypothetical protein